MSEQVFFAKKIDNEGRIHLPIRLRRRLKCNGEPLVLFCDEDTKQIVIDTSGQLRSYCGYVGEDNKEFLMQVLDTLAMRKCLRSANSTLDNIFSNWLDSQKASVMQKVKKKLTTWE